MLAVLKKYFKNFHLKEMFSISYFDKLKEVETNSFITKILIGVFFGGGG